MELSIRRSQGQEGSGLLLAMFVMVLLTAAGVVLLSVMDTELRTNQVDQRGKKSFFVAEAGVNHGREALRVQHLSSTDPDLRFTQELRALAGPNPADPNLRIDFNPATVRPVYDGAGAFVGLSGVGDDIPLVGKTAIGEGWYYAFLTNDDIDVELGQPLKDTNNRVKIAGVGVGPNRSFEVVEAVVDNISLLPPDMPATILMLGPSPNFDGGASNKKVYSGDDCETGPSVPVVGVVGQPAENDAKAGVEKGPRYTTHDNGEPNGVLTGVDTIQDLTRSDGFEFDEKWMDCQYLVKLATMMKNSADVLGTADTPNSALGTKDNPKITFIDGDYTINAASKDLGGVLVVTGTLTMSGATNWYGPIFIIGDGIFDQNGAGNGTLLGANVVANVSGKDGAFGTKDDCAGADGVFGTTDDGFGEATWYVSGMGGGSAQYCSKYIDGAFRMLPIKPTHFRQW